MAFRARLLGVFTALGIVHTAGAQSDTVARSGAAPHRSVLTARSTHGAAVRMDGRLDGAVWAGADSITAFRQREPLAGAPATEHTVVRVLRGRRALYIGVRAFDRDPAAIRATQLRRDADLTTDDYVTVLIDSFHDRRSAFVFRTNPNGAMWDAQFSGVDNLNADWNGVWEVAVSRDSLGWTAEFRIPFTTLRYNAGSGAAFGFNVQRFIRRKNEETLWRSWGRAQGLYQLAAEGELVGLGILARAHNVTFRPYALGRAIETAFDSSGARTGRGSVGGKVGLDAKTAVTPTLTADLTLNTDFAQVESDRQVLNLTRFPLFFPEKRTFFLESSGIFDFGTSQRAQLFYSRRIGLDSNGSPVPILAGARLTGRVGPWTVGLLDTRTGAGDDANDAVVRVQHDLFARSYIGAILLDHEGPGVIGAARSGGLDIDLPLVIRGHNVEPKLWIAGTSTPGVPGTPLAWRVSTDYPNDLFDNFVSIYRIDAGFNPVLGFVRRTGIWETTGHVDYMPRPGRLGIRQLDFEAPIPSWDIIADRSGSLADPRTWQTARLNWQLLGGTFQSGDRFAVSVQRFLDAPTAPFAIFRSIVILPARYWWTREELQYRSSLGRPVNITTDLNWGSFYGGRSTDASVTATWRAGGHTILGMDAERNEASLPGGRFVAVSTGGRLEYAFTTHTDLLVFAQTNNDAQRADFDVRFHWIAQPGDDLYVVWNSGYTTASRVLYRFPSREAVTHPLNGAFVVKAVHRLAF